MALMALKLITAYSRAWAEYLSVRSAIVSGACVAPVATIALWTLSVPLALAILALSHALVLYPTLRPRCQWLGPVITRFGTARHEVWLTIDDGPDPDDTPATLELLAQYEARATFFVTGVRAARHPQLVAMIVARGHGVANHSYTHPSGSFWCLFPRHIASEVDRCNAVLERLTGSRPVLFRAPVGMKNPFVHPILARRRMRLVGWSARGFDGVPHTTPEHVVARIEPRLSPGAIVLLHQGKRLADGRSLGIETLRLLLHRLRAHGYSTVIPDPASLVP
jgi:peptidoglycan/xylan/chitin deacetylase (PgdA/CDA1 family)